MSLRPYQSSALESVSQHWRDGVNRQLIVLPTGTGKTQIAAHLPETLNMNGWEQMLFLTHRDELVLQSAEKISQYNPHLSVEIEKAKTVASPDADVIVASIQSLSRPERLKRFNPACAKIIVADEAHHVISHQWMSVLKYFRVLKGDPGADQSKILLGITATPGRPDSIGLERIFNKIVYQKTVVECIEEGWLAEPIGYRIWTDHDVSGVSTRQGDLAIGELERTINTPARNKLIVDKYIELGKRLPGIAFTADVAHTNDLTAAFCAGGVSAFGLTGKTPADVRRSVIDSYRAGKIDVLVSCQVLLEGFNAPIATVCMMARPTKSTLLYCQAIGRTLRPFPAPEDASAHSGYIKANALILDLVDACGHHRLVNISTLFGLRASFDPKGKPIRKIVKEVERLERENPGLDLRSAETPEELRALVERIDLLRPPTVSRASTKYSRFAWVEQGDGFYLGLPKQQSLSITENHLGEFEVWSQEGGRRTLSFTGAKAEAFAMADQLVPQDATGLVLTSARWRQEEPTLPQCEKLFRWDMRARKSFGKPVDLYNFAVKRFKAGDSGWCRGSVSQRIDAVTSAR